MSSAADLINKMPDAFDSSAAMGLNCTLQFNVSTPMHVVIQNGACEAKAGSSPAPDVTVTMEDEDFVALMTGELNGMTAFMTGKLQVEGDLMLAQRMPSIFDGSKLS
jgi:putative sterol carrier protein